MLRIGLATGLKAIDGLVQADEKADVYGNSMESPTLIHVR